MERERGSKVIAIVALCVGVIGLSLGFAAFSSNLTIKSTAQVNPEDNFSVVFVEPITPTENGGVAGQPTVSTNHTTQGTETVESSTVGDLSATFTAPGQSVTYTFNAENQGSYIAYLTDVVFNNVAGKESTKVCTVPATGTTEAYVNGDNGACQDITLTLTIDGTQVTPDSFASVINPGTNNTAVYAVTIAYNEREGQQLADGPFSVAFGDIELTYGSIANQ